MGLSGRLIDQIIGSFDNGISLSMGTSALNKLFDVFSISILRLLTNFDLSNFVEDGSM